jgi:hypothetical protein
MAVVVKGFASVLVHAPDFVRYGSKPMRDLAETPALMLDIDGARRSFDQVIGYPPNQVFVGNLSPDDLHGRAQPWYRNLLTGAQRQGPFGEIMPQEEFYGWLKIADPFDAVSLEQ